ncbi:MAG: DNA replication protein, partial [Negativicutes bacterium]|nr:DNA replication protein [Negativicutes bacterium]
MAQRRMFSKRITDTDIFTDMPLSSQCLYFHLNMNADDDGFVDKVKRVKTMIGASDDDLKLLLSKGFLIPFETGIVVIKDWKIHNYIQKDRYQPTIYQEEKQMLIESESGAYAECIQDVYIPDTQVRLGKVREVKEVSSLAEQSIPFQSIIDYLNEKSGKNYKASSAANKKLIKARWNEGYREEDFAKVVDNKVIDWKGKTFSDGTNAEKYLQPSTLFGNKFDSYLNQNETTGAEQIL